MELREFAERVLFATSLEEKLEPPGPITDEKPGAPIETPSGPGRPAELRFKPGGTGRNAFPGIERIGNPEDRGRLLHFFANHELLATELMALVLLRFPNAPAAFRMGVLQTLQDEQEHTRLYLSRMRECGIHFGELPVSGYFWRAVAPMENPIDYVAGLCLTFEQANLDFARHYGRAFEEAGDNATARLLDGIYRDEIGHVAYGLKWFRRWKNPNESDWDAFCRQLKFPLSPQRAKGFTLNVEGRRAAGFDERFIAELEVYSQSRGRTPGIFLFNPFAEGWMAQGPAFTPRRSQAELARDLENLPQFLSRQDDIVLVERRPSVEFLSGIKRAGFDLPEFVELNAPVGLATDRRSLSIRIAEALEHRKIGQLKPWAWGPDSVELLQPLFAKWTGRARTAEQCFNPRVAELYSKAWSARLLRQQLEAHAAEPWLCSPGTAGIAARTPDEAALAISTLRERGYCEIVLKHAFGVAGNNALRLSANDSLESHRSWTSRAFQGGHGVVVEPWMDRLVDFSIQMEMTADGLKLCGYTGLINDRRGRFRGNTTEPGYEKRIPTQVLAALDSRTSAPDETARPLVLDLKRRLRLFYSDLFNALEGELHRTGYVGPLGIDAFVYRDLDGTARLKPIVEINPRYTMGRLTLELMRRACPGSYGWFRLLGLSTVRTEGFEGFPDYACALRNRYPLRMEGEPSPRIREGALCLNDPERARVCLAVLHVASHPFQP
ncbi:MAG TPA: ferritin-like domain-containing protein [Verrucomicrobia bacterium]|nr:ferritin-like domain-containing protein [Verrucomicrobiota bacterium]HOB33095.1 DUF455 family protein [Verrucomicrobiota bacterium]HOP97086.1 DUF455 family protein [Verrucomicrobiota bacterium]